MEMFPTCRYTDIQTHTQRVPQTHRYTLIAVTKQLHIFPTMHIHIHAQKYANTYKHIQVPIDAETNSFRCADYTCRHMRQHLKYMHLDVTCSIYGGVVHVANAVVKQYASYATI